MKSYNGLYDAMLQVDEIEASIDEAARNKMNRASVRRVLAHKHEQALALRYLILSGQWRPKRHAVNYIQEGSHRKKRNIIKPTWHSEQIVHHMLARQLEKVYGPSVYRYVAGTIKLKSEKKGKGPLFCKRTVNRWIHSSGGRRLYVAELDVSKFFDSVDTEILKGMLRKKIRDRRFLEVLFLVIDSAAPGIPKGYYLSPWFAQIYLSGLDNYIQQQLRPKHYLRFVDNFFLLHPNKRELHRMVRAIMDYAAQKLHLKFNPSRQVYRFEKDGKGRAVNCVGYIIHDNRTTMRKTILKRARGKALRIHKNHRCTVHDAATMLSYKGWFRQTATYNYFQKYVKPNVSIRYCRRRVSKAAKKRREQQKNDRMDRRAQHERHKTAGT